jgi:hypothetical protein
MSYLYGDSTPSTLEVNYIDFLRDAVEFCVQVLLADQRIAEGKARTRALDQATAAEIVKLQKVGALVPKAFEGVPFGEAESAAARCVATIVRSAGELVRAATAEARATLDADVARRDAEAARERELCVKALEVLLVKHDLPDMTSEMRVALGGGRYACRAQVTAKFGLEAAVDLEVPASHLFERIVRVDRLAERLDIQVPEVGGWLHKEVKMRAHHLEKHHLIELGIGAAGTTVKLRLAPDGSGPGFDVTFAGQAAPVRVVRVDQHENEPFDAAEGDVPKLRALREKLAAAAAELGKHRKAVVEAKMEGVLLRDHGKPSLIVERLIDTIAPVVQEIAARSQSPGELVLRRLIGGGRREEIFLSKQELKVKLDPLGIENRALFDPLWVEGGAVVTPHTAVTRLAIPFTGEKAPANASATPAPSSPTPPANGSPTSPATSATPTPPPARTTGAMASVDSRPPPPPPSPEPPLAPRKTPTQPATSVSSEVTKPSSPTPPAIPHGSPLVTTLAGPPLTPLSSQASSSPASTPSASSISVSATGSTSSSGDAPKPGSTSSRPPTPAFGMSPLTMAIVEGASSSPPPAPPARGEARGRATTGSIEVTARPSAARILDRPPPSSSYAEVEVTLDEKKRAEPPGPSGKGS